MLSFSKYRIVVQNHALNRRVAARSLVALYHTTSTSFATDDVDKKNLTFKEKVNKAWSGPNFKYWFIGTTAFVSWMTYYGIKTYKKTRIDIEMLPSLPNHFTVRRDEEMNELYDKYKAQTSIFGSEPVKKLMVLGPSASGKTILVHDFVKLLQEKLNGFKSILPRSRITVFLQGDSQESFLISLKAFAAKLRVKPVELEDNIETPDYNFNTAPFEIQCNALLECIHEKLKKHSSWIIVFDNVHSTSPQSVTNVIKQWFIENECGSKWSSGTAIIVYDGIVDHKFGMKNDLKYHMKQGLTLDKSCRLLQEVANLEKAVTFSSITGQLIEKVYSNPLGILCAGILLREKLSQKEVMSIEKAVKELCKEIDDNLFEVWSLNQQMSDFIKSKSGATLVTIETVVAMVINDALKKDQHLYHGFDLIATLKPGAVIPQSLLTRHLRNRFYKLQPLVQPSSGLAEVFNKQKNDLDTVKSKAEEFEPKGKAWSNKNLAEYVRKVEDFFLTGINTVKDIYNMFYGELPPLPEKADGLDMFRLCELLLTSTVEPGSVKALCMHPLVYNAARQHFLSSTIYNMESEHLLENQMFYHHQSWYRKLSKFSEQACLQKYRLAAGHSTSSLGIPSDISPESYLFRYNLGINISSIFFETPFLHKQEDFWLPKGSDKLRYLQSHISRVITSLCDEISVTKQDLAGRSAKKHLIAHLEYILDNHPIELLGQSKQIEGLQTVASCVAELYNDHARSKEVLENILQLQRSSSTTHPLDIAKTLTRLAELHNSCENYELSRSLLEEAAELHEIDRRKCGEYKRCLEFGKLLGLLGVVYGSLNLKRESKETLERSLMLLQATPPDLADEAKSKQFGADFASSLTDLGHSYVSLGMPLYGKKILDLALAAHKNLHGDDHPEVVRAMTVLAVAHLMQGHNEESKKLRYEAGKLQAKINALPVY